MGCIIPIFTAPLPHSPTPPLKIVVEKFLRFGINQDKFSNYELLRERKTPVKIENFCQPIRR